MRQAGTLRAVHGLEHDTGAEHELMGGPIINRLHSKAKLAGMYITTASRRTGTYEKSREVGEMQVGGSTIALQSAQLLDEPHQALA